MPVPLESVIVPAGLVIAVSAAIVILPVLLVATELLYNEIFESLELITICVFTVAAATTPLGCVVVLRLIVVGVSTTSLNCGDNGIGPRRAVSFTWCVMVGTSPTLVADGVYSVDTTDGVVAVLAIIAAEFAVYESDVYALVVMPVLLKTIDVTGENADDFANK